MRSKGRASGLRARPFGDTDMEEDTFLPNPIEAAAYNFVFAPSGPGPFSAAAARAIEIAARHTPREDLDQEMHQLADFETWLHAYRVNLDSRLTYN